MTRREKPPEGLSREESRFLDGELPPDEARQLERRLAADPERADRLEAYREAMEVWREDAARTVDAVDAKSALADRVLAEVTGARPRMRRSTPPAFARWYAAAAVLLIAVGIGGTVWTQTSRKDAPGTRRPGNFKDIEQAVLDLVMEVPELSTHPTSLKEGR